VAGNLTKKKQRNEEFYFAAQRRPGLVAPKLAKAEERRKLWFKMAASIAACSTNRPA
jgi:hypothetical protein